MYTTGFVRRTQKLFILKASSIDGCVRDFTCVVHLHQSVLGGWLAGHSLLYVEAFTQVKLQITQ